MASEQLIAQLQEEKTLLIHQISDLRRSVEELSHERSLILDEISDGASRGSSSKKVIIDELLVEVEDDLTVAFDNYFGTEEPFVNEIRKALLEDN